MSKPNVTTKRVRPGMVEVTDPTGRVWEVEERRDTFGGGNAWAWFATSDGDALDPMPTLTDVKWALSEV